MTDNGTMYLAGFGAWGLNDTVAQADIDAGDVNYDHDDSETTTDAFSFSLADGGEDGAAPATGTLNDYWIMKPEASDKSLLTVMTAITMPEGKVDCNNIVASSGDCYPLPPQKLMRPSMAILLRTLQLCVALLLCVSLQLCVALLLCVSLLLCLATSPALVVAQQPIALKDPITLKDVEEGLPDITADEPYAAEFSAEKAAQYLDRSALNWQKTKKCATCHTNLFYMAARPAMKTILPDSGEVRSFYEDYLKVRWQNKRPTEAQGFWPIVVGTGLTLNDVQTTGKLSDVSREVLDIMWTVQRKDGGWKWPDCDYAPLEIDDHYGVTIAALTVGIAPGGYAATPQARAGLEKLRKYLKNNPPKSLHHRAMLAWCSIRVDGIATEKQRKETLAELLTLQLDDGGWSTAGFLTDWKGLVPTGRKPLDTKTSDGYGTGFAIVVARELGVPADDPRLRRGIDWLLANQRESGKWFTRSPVNECGNLISNVGSAYAVLALQACGELQGWPFDEAKPTSR